MLKIPETYNLTHDDAGHAVWILVDDSALSDLPEKFLCDTDIAWCPESKTVYIRVCGAWRKSGAELYAIEDDTTDIVWSNEATDVREFHPYSCTFSAPEGSKVSDGYSITMGSTDISGFITETEDDDSNVIAVTVDIPHVSGAITVSMSSEVIA